MNDKKSEHEKMLDALLPETIGQRGGPVELQVWPARAGALWVRQGFDLFKQRPLAWLGAIAVVAFVMMGLGWLPVAGDILAFLLGPVLNAGLMYYASRLALAGEAGIGHLFVGLRVRTAALVGLGALNMLVMFLLVMLMAFMMAMSLGEETLKALSAALEAEDMDAVKSMVEPHAQVLLLDFLVVMLVYIPWAAALWFSPPLVLMHGCRVTLALKLSVMACLRNFMALLVYSLVLVGWACLGGLLVVMTYDWAVVLSGLLMVLFLLAFIGLLVAAQWVSFAAIFPQQEAGGSQPDENGQGSLLL